MARLTKTLVVVSLLVAELIQARYASIGWPALQWLALAAFGATWLLARWKMAAGTAIPLGIAYVAPAIFVLFVHFFHYTYLSIWMAALAGVPLADRRVWSWSVAARFRWPLALWGLTLAVAWPIVMLREFDFTLELLGVERLMNTGAGEHPVFLMSWVLSMAVAQLLGILWFDWMVGRYGELPFEHFRREVLVPLAVSVAVTALLGVYQISVDLNYLSGGPWARFKRAAGGMLDANPFGMICAMWAPVSIALVVDGRRRWTLAVGTLLMVLCWAATWASGSRTALAVAALGTLVLLWQSGSLLIGSRARIGRTGAVAGAIAAAGFVAVAIAASTWEGGPLRKILPMLPAPTPEAVRALVVDLWDRSIYGPAAVEMIGHYPLAGVGVGSYHFLVGDYMQLMINTRYYADNAQNWYRHQLAEFGLLGSVGWIAWALVFAVALAAPLRSTERRFEAGLVRGALVAFALLSLVGMPAQSPAVVLTFWVFAFWYLRARGPLSPPAADRPVHAAAGWLLTWAFVACYAGAALVYARGPLRVANRAVTLRYEFDYQYGLSRAPDDPTLVWTGKHAVIVPLAPEKWLKLTVWADHPDANDVPVNAEVWVNGASVMRYPSMPRGVKSTKYVLVPGGNKRFVLEAQVDRTYRPEGCDAADCERGLTMRWELVPRPPEQQPVR